MRRDSASIFTEFCVLRESSAPGLSPQSPLMVVKQSYCQAFDEARRARATERTRCSDGEAQANVASSASSLRNIEAI